METLTPFEVRLLEGMAAGFTAREHATFLSLEAGTVAKYRTRLRRKLGARNAVHAVALGYQTGLLE